MAEIEKLVEDPKNDNIREILDAVADLNKANKEKQIKLAEEAAKKASEEAVREATDDINPFEHIVNENAKWNASLRKVTEYEISEKNHKGLVKKGKVKMNWTAIKNLTKGVIVVAGIGGVLGGFIWVSDMQNKNSIESAKRSEIGKTDLLSLEGEQQTNALGRLISESNGDEYDYQYISQMANAKTEEERDQITENYFRNHPSAGIIYYNSTHESSKTK